jgi:hypothetical protein
LGIEIIQRFLRLFAGFSMLIENASSMKGNEAGGETRDYLL